MATAPMTAPPVNTAMFLTTIVDAMLRESGEWKVEWRRDSGTGGHFMKGVFHHRRLGVCSG
jgi:hypothetical protein